MVEDQARWGVTMAFGSNGQWSRVRNEAGAKAFLGEQELDAEHRRRADERDRAVAGWVRDKLGALVARLRRR